jgi:4'-phosphopantetheinyl transferase
VFPDNALTLFPEDDVKRIERFVREPDRRLRYAAAEMLSQLIGEHYPDRPGMNVVRDQYGRPQIKGASDVDVSISNSGEIVVCALAFGGKIGIDIEQVRPVDYRDFESVFPESLNTFLPPSCGVLESGYANDESFFHAWTRLESVIKADGRGLSAPLLDIVFEGRTAHINGGTWYLTRIPVTAGYICTLAANLPVIHCDVKSFADCR